MNLSDPLAIAIEPDLADICSTVYMGFGSELRLDSVVRREWNEEDEEALVVVVIDGSVDADESLSTTSTTAHAPEALRPSFDATEFPLDRRRSLSIPLDRLLELELGGPDPEEFVPEEGVWDLTTKCRPNPVNRAGEVLYLRILGLIGAKFSRALMGNNGVCSNADIDALELNETGKGGDGLSSSGVELGEVDNVMVATEAPLD